MDLRVLVAATDQMEAACRLGAYLVGMPVRDDVDRVIRESLLSQTRARGAVAAKAVREARSDASPGDDPRQEFRDSLEEDLIAIPPADVSIAKDVFAETKKFFATFRDAECFGGCLDLFGLFEEFVLKFDYDKDYGEFLKTLPTRPSSVTEARSIAEYDAWVMSVVEYLEDFHKRVYPLEPSPRDSISSTKKFASIAECEKLGMNGLKEELISRGMKCGGSLKQRATRLFDSQTTTEPHERILSKLLLENDRLSEALKECVLKTSRDATRSQVEINSEYESAKDVLKSKISKAYDAFISGNALLDDAGDMEGEEGGLVDTKANRVYLDETGTPIPYWQFKLQGLDKSFACGVCGDATYQGPRAFKSHFVERRHAIGLKRILGDDVEADIAVFDGITEPIEVSQLADSLKAKRRKIAREETEDVEGNVVVR